MKEKNIGAAKKKKIDLEYSDNTSPSNSNNQRQPKESGI